MTTLKSDPFQYFSFTQKIQQCEKNQSRILYSNIDSVTVERDRFITRTFLFH